MKIDSKVATYEIAKHLTNKTPAAAEGRPSSPQSGPDKAGTSSKAAVVHISHASKEAQLAEKIIADAPETRDAKVADLKARIAAGDYKIDREEIASKMIDQDLEELF
jgi:flagellar biosynthesis anti-sigma factor FlgM